MRFRRKDEVRRREAAQSTEHEVTGGQEIPGRRIPHRYTREEVEMVERMMDDESDWGDPLPVPKKRSEKRRRTAMFSIRLSPAELEIIAWAAEFHGQTVSGYIRSIVLREATRPQVKITAISGEAL